MKVEKEFVDTDYCKLCHSSTAEKIESVDKKVNWLIVFGIINLVSITGYLLSQFFKLPMVQAAIK